MIKYFCDGCKKEMEDQQEAGSFTLFEKNYSVSTMSTSIKEYPYTLNQLKYLLCIDCARKVKEYIEHALQKTDIKTKGLR